MHLSPHETHIIHNHQSLSIPHHARPLSSLPEVDEPQWLEFHRGGWLTTKHAGKRVCRVPLAYQRKAALSYPLAFFGTALGHVAIMRFPTMEN